MVQCCFAEVYCIQSSTGPVLSFAASRGQNHCGELGSSSSREMSGSHRPVIRQLLRWDCTRKVGESHCTVRLHECTRCRAHALPPPHQSHVHCHRGSRPPSPRPHDPLHHQHGLEEPFPTWDILQIEVAFRVVPYRLVDPHTGLVAQPVHCTSAANCRILAMSDIAACSA